VLYCAKLIDQHEIAQHAGDEKAPELDMLLALLTPIAKAWVSEYCIDANSLAIQVLGGCGYTHDYPVERLYRDNRLNAIVEGTTGIQAMDLLGRKVAMGNGAALRLLMSRIEATMDTAKDIESLAPHAAQLSKTCQAVAATTMSIMGTALGGEIEKFLANATPYLHALGHTVIAWLWLEQGIVVSRQLDAAPEDEFLLGKQQAMRYFFNWELPRVSQWLQVLEPIDTTCLDMKPGWF
jgi:butyryl-CoA dehydrogenase